MRSVIRSFLVFVSCLGCTGVVFAQTPTYSGIGKDSVSPEILKKFSPPDLDLQVRERIQALLDVRSPGLGQLHPNGKSLFFTWRITGSSQVWRVDSPLGFPVQMTGGEHTTALRDITPDGKFLILSRDRNGEENPGLYLQSVKGGELQMIQHLPKVQTSFSLVTDDSRYIYFRSNQEDPSSFYIYRYDLKLKTTEKIFGQKGFWFISDFTKDRLLLGRAITNTAFEYFDYNLSDKKLTPVVGQNELFDYRVQYGPRLGQYLVTTNRFGDFKGVYFFDLKQNRWEQISPKLEFDIEGQIDLARRRVFFSTNRGGYVNLSAIDARTKETVKLPSFPGADHVWLGELSRSGKSITVGVETASAPRTSYSYNFASGKLTQWVKPTAPEVDLAQFTKAELISIPTRDKQSISAFIRVPDVCKSKLCPIVVSFHGGPEAQSMPGFSVYAHMFNEQGFIFVEPNVRGSTGYGKAYLDSDNGPRRLEVITDIPDTAEFLKTKFSRDGNAPKIGVTGGSYGGYSTLYAMTRFAGTYDAGVSSVGMSDLRTFLLNTAPYRRALRISEYGDPEKDKEALRQLSPITFVNQVNAPLLIIQGVSDPRVPAGEAVQFFDRISRRKVPVGLILFADEGHGSQKRSNQVLEIGHTIAWFKKHLQ